MNTLLSCLAESPIPDSMNVMNIGVNFGEAALARDPQ